MVWLIIALMIAINALYVAAEFATVSVRRSRVQQMAEEGNGAARRLLPILNNPLRQDNYIAACQIGITLSSLVVGAYGQARLAPILTPLFERFGGMQEAAAFSAATLLILIVLTVFQMVLGELVPKSLALQFSTQVALFTVIPMIWSLRLLSWFIKVLNGSGVLILKLLGFPAAGNRHVHSPEEIDLLIADSRDGGLLEPDEQRRLHQALQLASRPAHQLMVPRPYLDAISIDSKFQQLLEKAATSAYTRIPVYKGSLDTIVGIIHTRDLVVRYLEGRDDLTVEKLMRPVVAVPESITADKLLAVFREQRSHQAIVVDEFGGVAGLVTLEDILSELMGDVGDEFKLGQPIPERLPDGRVRLPGLMRLDEAEPWIGLRWVGNVDTVAGRVLQSLNRVPSPGEQVVIDGIPVEVEEVTNRAIVAVLITPRERSKEAEND